MRTCVILAVRARTRARSSMCASLAMGDAGRATHERATSASACGDEGRRRGLRSRLQLAASAAPPSAPSVSAVTAQTSASSRSGERPDDKSVEAEVAHLVLQRRKRAGMLAPGPARRARRPARRAAICRASRAPRSPAPRDRPRAITARTMSPPWLTSATSASACSRRHSAIAVARPAGGRQPRRGLVGEHIDACRPRRGRRRRGRRRRRPCARRRRRIDRDDDALQAAAPRRRGSSRSCARDHSASARSSTISPSSSWRPSRVPA